MHDRLRGNAGDTVVLKDFNGTAANLFVDGFVPGDAIELLGTNGLTLVARDASGELDVFTGEAQISTLIFSSNTIARAIKAIAVSDGTVLSLGLTIDQVSKNNETQQLLYTDTDGSIISTKSNGSITFVDPSASPSWTATIQDQTVEAFGPRDETVALTAKQEAAIKAAFTLKTDMGSSQAGSLGWALDSTALTFVGDGERIKLVSNVSVADKASGSDTATVSANIYGEAPTKQIAESNIEASAILEKSAALIKVLGTYAKADQTQSFVKAVDGFVEDIEHRFSLIGLSADVAQIGIDLYSDLKDARSNSAATYFAYQNATARVETALEKAAFTTSVVNAVQAYGPEVATWAADGLLGAEGSAAFQASFVLVFGASAPAVAGAVILVGTGLAAGVAFDKLLKEPVLSYWKQVYAQENPFVSTTDQIIGLHGYLSGSTVFVDDNGNGVLDQGEQSGKTDASGRVSLPSGLSPLVLTGGYDTATGLPFAGALEAPAGSQIISPLTTLVERIQVAGGGTLGAAEAKVLNSFGLGTADLLTNDAEAGTLQGDAVAAKLFVAGSLVESTVRLLAAAGSTDPFAALASLLDRQPVALDLTNSATLASVAAKAGVGGTAASSFTTLATAINGLLLSDAASAQPGAALFRIVSAVSRAAEGIASQALAAALASADPNALKAVLAAYTGIALANAVQAAQGSIVVPGQSNNDVTTASLVAPASVSDPSTTMSAAGSFGFTHTVGSDPDSVSISFDAAKSSTATAVGFLVPVLGTEPVNSTPGQVGWTYKVADSQIAKLTAGQTLTEVFDVTIDDHHGDKTVTPITVTLTGSKTAGVPMVAGHLVSDTGASATDRITKSDALTGTGDAYATVHFSVDGKVVSDTAQADANGDWSYTPAGLKDGSHVVVASETNTAGTGKGTFIFTLDTTPPVPTLSGASLKGTQTTLSGTVSPNSTVTVSDGSTVLGNAKAGTDGSWSLASQLSSAPIHSFTTTATDLAGNTGTAAGQTLYAPGGNAALVGSTGNDILIGRPGDTLTGGAGQDTFVFQPAFGQESVTDFTPAILNPQHTITTPGDVLQIAHTLFVDFQTMMAHAQQVGANTLITADPTNTITLKNTQLTALHTQNFHFA